MITARDLVDLANDLCAEDREEAWRTAPIAGQRDCGEQHREHATLLRIAVTATDR